MTSKEKPILFSGEMVRAILDGRKTQTRRVVKPDSSWLKFYNGNKEEALAAFHRDAGSFWNPANLNAGDTAHWQSGDDRVYPNYQVGDRLWVKETHFRWGKLVKNGLTKKGKQAWKFQPMGQKVAYAVMDTRVIEQCTRTEDGWHKRPSIHMRREYSRITLEITDVRVQRLQEISEEDALAEGVMGDECLSGSPFTADQPTPEMCYASLWESINGKGSWALNPYVWAITFKRIKP